jgi:predicted nucleic acid-binding protein
MIYLDTSVVLASLLSEDRSAPSSIWQQTLVASRLLACEVWVRMNARGVGASHAAQVNALLGRLAFVEMESRVLQRVLEPFPIPVRTLDAIHLATVWYLRNQGQSVQLATFDDRMADAARRMRLELYDLSAVN